MYIVTSGKVSTKRVDRIRICPRWDMYSAKNMLSAVSPSGADASCNIRLVIEESPEANISLVGSSSKDDDSFVQHEARRATAQLKAEEIFLRDIGAS